MTEKKPDAMTLKEVADTMCQEAVRYYRENTVEEDARREAEEDARIGAALKKLRREGKLPPTLKKGKILQKVVPSRFGPAPSLIVCAFLAAALAIFGIVAPIDGQRKMEILPLFLVSAGLLGWGMAIGIKARQFYRAEKIATILAHPFSMAWGYNLLFSMPLLVALAAFYLLRGEPPFIAFVSVLIWGALMALREADSTVYILDRRLHIRTGWLHSRRESAPVLEQVQGVRVDRDLYRGAPSYVLKFEFKDPLSFPRLTQFKTRYRNLEQANAEAERWRDALKWPNLAVDPTVNL